MTRSGALVEDLHPLAAPDDDDVVLLVEAPEERRDGHLGRMGEPRERGEAGRRLAVLDLGDHAEGDLGDLGELRHRQSEGPPCVAHPFSDDPTDVIRRKGGGFMILTDDHRHTVLCEAMETNPLFLSSRTIAGGTILEGTATHPQGGGR